MVTKNGPILPFMSKNVNNKVSIKCIRITQLRKNKIVQNFVDTFYIGLMES